ncbi:unnamed protein product [Larinioides sclopetarius]|uniref:Uncharacterized protein n=1 Tax=Larinioides sclopetarius TaxID=280406 RepID=A0AAV2AH91_9ARAC
MKKVPLLRGLPIDHPILSLDPDLVPEDVDQNAIIQEDPDLVPEDVDQNAIIQEGSHSQASFPDDIETAPTGQKNPATSEAEESPPTKQARTGNLTPPPNCNWRSRSSRRR